MNKKVFIYLKMCVCLAVPNYIIICFCSTESKNKAFRFINKLLNNPFSISLHDLFNYLSLGLKFYSKSEAILSIANSKARS